jgi:hypothetical protein
VARKRGTSLLSPTAYLRRNAVHRGLFRGHRGWMAVGAVMWAPRMIGRVFGRHEETLVTEKLKPGQFVRVDAVAPPTRKERKAAKAAAKSA